MYTYTSLLSPLWGQQDENKHSHTLLPVGVSRLNSVPLRIWKRVPLSDCRQAVMSLTTPLSAAASRTAFLSSWA